MPLSPAFPRRRKDEAFLAAPILSLPGPSLQHVLVIRYDPVTALSRLSKLLNDQSASPLACPDSAAGITPAVAGN